MPLSGAGCDSEGWFFRLLCHFPHKAGTQFSSCPEASATSPSAPGQQTPATSGSGSPVGSDQPDTDQQSMVCVRRKIML